LKKAEQNDQLIYFSWDLLYYYVDACIVYTLNWSIDSPFIGAFDMMFGPTKGGNLCHVILAMQNVIWANQKTESFVYRWLRRMPRMT